MPGMRRGGPGRRGAAAPAARRRSRRRTRRRVVRRTRRRVIVGGAMVFAVAGAAVKLSKNDAEKIEAEAGKPIEEMQEEELQGHMDNLGIEEQEVTDQDIAALEEEGEGSPATPEVSESQNATPQGSTDYTEELAKLSQLHDQGILTDEEFEAKKKQVLGL